MYGWNGITYIQSCWGTRHYVHPATVSSVVNFANCGEITDAGLRELAQHCHQLSSVDFAGCVKITDAGLRELGQHRHQLISVNFGVAFRFNDLHYVLFCTLFWQT